MLDRLVGYDLSGIIWKKVRYGLRGRVQSPRYDLAEREREITAFKPETFWVIMETETERAKSSRSSAAEPRDKGCGAHRFAG